ncbi:MAG: hypothetical protein LUG18_00655 [Candidatus Azobacteroides sp.]|nr:hypothetical protein [Candidatus Azobacteroides sp.]
MLTDLNLNSPEWRDLIFEGKNKNYGAYELRSSSDIRHIWSLILVSLLVISLILSSVFYKNPLLQKLL